MYTSVASYLEWTLLSTTFFSRNKTNCFFTSVPPPICLSFWFWMKIKNPEWIVLNVLPVFIMSMGGTLSSILTYYPCVSYVAYSAWRPRPDRLCYTYILSMRLLCGIFCLTTTPRPTLLYLHIIHASLMWHILPDDHAETDSVILTYYPCVSYVAYSAWRPRRDRLCYTYILSMRLLCGIFCLTTTPRPTLLYLHIVHASLMWHILPDDHAETDSVILTYCPCVSYVAYSAWRPRRDRLCYTYILSMRLLCGIFCLTTTPRPTLLYSSFIITMPSQPKHDFKMFRNSVLSVVNTCLSFLITESIPVPASMTYVWPPWVFSFFIMLLYTVVPPSWKITCRYW